MNTAIEYMYRDASNYKLHGRVVLAGEARERKPALYVGRVFDAEACGVPDLREGSGWSSYDDDPPLHEIATVRSTEEAPTVEDVGVGEFARRVFFGVTEHAP